MIAKYSQNTHMSCTLWSYTAARHMVDTTTPTFEISTMKVVLEHLPVLLYVIFQ